MIAMHVHCTAVRDPDRKLGRLVLRNSYTQRVQCRASEAPSRALWTERRALTEGPR